MMAANPAQDWHDLLAEEEVYEARVEQAREAADAVARNWRRYSDGSWSLNDWFDYSGHALEEFMPGEDERSFVGMVK